MTLPQAAGSNAADEARASHGSVVVYAPDKRSLVSSHEQVTHTGIAERLAALKGFAFAGDYNPSRRYPGPVYFVPGETLAGVEAARELGIRDEHDLFGGVVPHPQGSRMRSPR